MTALYLQLELATAQPNSAVSCAAFEASTPDWGENKLLRRV